MNLEDMKDINNILFYDLVQGLLNGQICHSLSPPFSFLFKLHKTLEPVLLNHFFLHSFFFFPTTFLTLQILHFSHW